MRSGFIGILALVATVSCQKTQDSTFEVVDLAAHVRPHVGTSGYGNVFVGASWPRGMVKVGPNTIVKPGSMSGYDYNNERIKGFVHSHLEGPGGAGNGYNRILVMPFVGSPEPTEESWSSTFSHDEEVVSPDYYSVRLASSGVLAELTASRLVGLHRWTYPAAPRAGVILDLQTSLGQWLESDLEVVGTDTVEGWSRYQTNGLISMFADLVDPGTGISTVYYSIKLDRPVDVSEWNPASHPGAFLVFSTEEGDVVEMRVGISYISVDQARQNREAIDGMTFEDVRAETRGQWNRLLSRVRIESDRPDDVDRFYTAFYHSLLAPADYTEGNRFFSGADGKGQTWLADGWRYYTDDWCMWDTYRTSHPWFSIIEPEVNSDMIRSIVHTYEAGGWMQKCTWNATGDSRCMTANPQFCVIADGFLKGFDDFDIDLAWEGMKKGSLQDSENPLPDGMCGYFNRGTPPDYVDLGFVSMDCDVDQSASMTLEHAHNDWCVARFARAIGQDEWADFFLARSMNYVNHWNQEAGFMVPKNRDGSWLQDFDPVGGAGFCEADSWKYTWSVPQDVCGLVELMGGPENFVAKLDQFFDGGHFAMDNQPDFHVPWLYAFAGAAARTQETVSDLMARHFHLGPDGLPGNDDAGSMSTWLVFASLGFYPVTPGGDTYIMNAPLFDRVELFIDPEGEARRFEIVAQGLDAESRYIQSATLNGKPLEFPEISHSDIVAGGRLVLKMGPEPSAWGTAICDR
ncbi:MAG TPA: GH92 family glycosyl hydrolase [Myxococcota bacterium]|nr:GH92 family glycosyl hydrolase [Myxococcota bacterium]HOD00041.1 GH92 family glycosyl hydrolase [Myxococcota bacterium]HPV03348.1 GH92 family glycosyl hydrolase [Myxococcota bacterium]